jgi:hypothetical protein
MTTPPAECPYTFQDILNAKISTEEKLKRDYKNLKTFPATTNPRKFCGNPTLYHYQFKNLLNCRRGNKGYTTLEEELNDPALKKKLWAETIQRNRRDKDPVPNATDVYECHRINRGSIVPFKSSTAKYIYKKFNATNVLDPTAGWGGRLLGASSLGIRYSGIDTNINLKDGYDRMIKDLGITNCDMYFEDCLSFPFECISPDLILTSPPYSNLEMYECMEGWDSDDDFYKSFMIPLFQKIDDETDCPACINISPKMYKALITKYDVRECDEKIDLRQQLGKQYKTKSQDYIYVWYPEYCILLE